ncbi:MAG: L-seryl-tRNA(Sec) selenium transferase [Atribacterota bacterium]|nr:L-seryl-tRNA(Sec) selenium transferase [Atribacterota bacterium]MDD5637714.1 L-seryl-tRNA(Sec) selenium transferase [Atribacterota bacterium]
MTNNHNKTAQNNFHAQLAQIPSVEEVLQQEEIEVLTGQYSRPMITPLVRQVLAEERERIRNGSTPSSLADISTRCVTLIRKEYQSFIQPVINGTGVILHTNLGRAVLGKAIINDSLPSLVGYSNLEYDLFRGERGKRGDFVERMLAEFSQSESSLILNNNAAAVFLILKVLAKGKEVIISRGELVQIGGGFRIPDILRESSAILREVGTTNQTNLDDYREAINENTALLLKVHQSNFSLEGFSHSVSTKELKILGEKYKLPVVADLGSGSFLSTEQFTLVHEPMVQEMIRSGADLVCFSADKLLGGPQGGIICGRREYINQIRKDPLYRVFRVGKITLSLLQSTLLFYLQGRIIQEIPVWKMISLSGQEIKRRSQALAQSLRKRGIPAQVIEGVSLIGGGSLPGKTLPTYLLSIKTEGNIDELDQRLRLSRPAVLGRVKDNCLFFDPRTIESQFDKKLIELISSAFYQKN